MTISRTPDIKEEVDIVRIDPLFLERQRNRYASRAVAFLVILNGIAALLLLSNFVNLRPLTENAPTVADAMVVFGAGVAAALASMFFAHLRRSLTSSPRAYAFAANRLVACHACRRRQHGLLCSWIANGGRSRGPRT